MREEPFSFSDFPARWFPPLAGLLLASGAWLAGHLALDHAAPGLALIVTGSVVAVVGLAGRLLVRYGVMSLPIARREAVNLVGLPPENADPHVWLVAHLDSKSQTIPMLLRMVAIALFAIATAALAIVLTITVLTERESLARVAHLLGWIGAISIAPLALTFIGNRSPGALDNATGVATVLDAADTLRGRGVGVVVTSGEELALAGARAFTGRRKPAVAINCDTIDDNGRYIFMASGRVSPELESAVARTVAAEETVVWRIGPRIVGPMLPGVLADNVALTDAGWRAFTVSRGNLGTLARVHTSKDNARHARGSAVKEAAALLSKIATELT